MIVGNDISQYNTIDWNIYKNNSNFVIIKCSEGTGYTDPQFSVNQFKARQAGLPLGYYHFARPDLGNTPEAEADWFIKAINGLREEEILFLDYEVTYHDPVGWCKGFLDRIKSTLDGYNGLIYLNQSLIKGNDWSSVSANYGLWVAAYTYDPNKNNFVTGSWGVAAFQQWTDKQQVPGISGNVDGDVFFGDATQFRKYGYHIPVPPVDLCEQKIQDLTVQLSVAKQQVQELTNTNKSLHDDLSTCQSKPPVITPGPVQEPTFTKPLAKVLYGLAKSIEGGI